MKKAHWVILLSILLIGLESKGAIINSEKSLKLESKSSKLFFPATLGNYTNIFVNQSPLDLENGKGYFYTSFKPNGFKEEVNIGDELFVRMNLGKTMIELSQANGIQADYTAYGFITVYIDDNMSFMAGPFSFPSNYSKKWQYIDIPLNVNPDFIEKISVDQSMLESEQDIWVFQQLFQENSIPKKYTASAMKTMSTGNHTLKVEFGLGESDSKEPKSVVCTGIVKVVSDDAGNKKLAINGPKNMRPLDVEEMGKFIFNSNAFTIGTSELTAKLELPNPPKYYNMKWCKTTSCDYDNGYIELYVSVDNEPVATWSCKLEGIDYTSTKAFDMVILPKTDAGIGKVEAPFNNSKLFKSENPVVYSLLDKIYSGNLKTGKHQLKIKAYSKECIPLNTEYEFLNSYFIQWPSIAETTIEFYVTEEGRNTMSNNSSAKKLSHALGEWIAVDKKLLESNSGVSDYQVIDIATTSEWKVVMNSLGAILYRECKADVLYKSKYGYRLQKSILVKEDYSGGGTYGSPYLAERIEFSFDSSLLNSMHLPVPASKIK